MKLIILAAGKGTRFLPITETTPKGLIEIEGKAMLEWVVTPFLPHITEIIFVINDNLGYRIKEHFGEVYKNIPVKYVIQGTEGKGTLYALQATRELLTPDELFCVCNSDDLFNPKEITDIFNNPVPGIGVSFSVMPWQYLGIDIKDNFVIGFRRHEKSTEYITDRFSNGIHFLSKEILDFNPVLNGDGEAGLPHTLFANINKYPLKAYEVNTWYAVNGPEDVDNAINFIKNTY